MEIQMVISLIAVIVSAGAAYFAWKQANRVYQVNRHTANIQLNRDLQAWSVGVLESLVELYDVVDGFPNQNKNQQELKLVYQKLLVARDAGGLQFAASYQDQKQNPALLAVQNCADLCNQLLKNSDAQFVCFENGSVRVKDQKIEGSKPIKGFVLDERHAFVNHMRKIITTRYVAKAIQAAE